MYVTFLVHHVRGAEGPPNPSGGVRMLGLEAPQNSSKDIISLKYLD